MNLFVAKRVGAVWEITGWRPSPCWLFLSRCIWFFIECKIVMSLALHNKVIFLTGGSCGIGRDCAKAYAAEGARVVIVARDKEGVEATSAELGAQHMGIVCDVARDTEVKAAVEKAQQHFGRLDAVHNNAGISSPSKAIHETTDDEWDEL